jgi:hypothetical protein
MESQTSLFRTAMRQIALLLPPYTPPVVCLKCAGWSSFGGRATKNVSMGPLCICDANWHRMEDHVRKLRTQHERTSLLQSS